MNCSVEEAEKRDPKGLYRKAREGVIKDFTGVSAPYEVPEDAEIVIHSATTRVEEAVRQVVEYLEEKGMLTKEKAAEDEKAAVS